MKLFTILLFAALIPFMGGCVARPSEPPDPAVKAESSDIELGMKLLEAIKTDDHAAFLRVTRGILDEPAGKDEFNDAGRQMREQFGQITAAEYLTSLETPLMAQLIYKVKFERSGSRNQPITQDVLFRVMLGKDPKGATKLIGFGFF